MNTQVDIEDENHLADHSIANTAAPHTKKPSKVKKLSFQVHRYVGIVVAVYMLMMSLSGTSLVFHDEIESWLCPESAPIKGESLASNDLIFQKCKEKFPQFEFGNLIADPEHRPTQVFGSGPEGKKITCESNPFTGEFIRLREGNQALKFLCELHFNLLNGSAGRTANGIGALILLTLTVTGLTIWWRGIQSIKASFDLLPKKATVTPRRRVSVILTRNLHATIGACLAPLLVVWGLSGFYFGFPSFVESTVNLFLPVSSQKNEPEIQGATPGRAETSITVDSFVKNARAAAVDFDFVSRISMPDKKKKSVRVWLLKSNATKEKCQVFLDPVSGSVLAVSKSQSTPAGDLFLQTLTKLHFGSIGGSTTKILWLIVGLTPAILAVSGIMIFVQKHLSKKRLHHK